MKLACKFAVKFAFVVVCLCSAISLTEEEEILIDLDKVIHVTDEKFVGVTIDSGILRRHWEHFDPKSIKLQTLASALSPCYLRVGGNDADFLIFKEDEGVANPADPTKTKHPSEPWSNSNPSIDNTLKWRTSEHLSGLAYWDWLKKKYSAKIKVSGPQSLQKVARSLMPQSYEDAQREMFDDGVVTNFTMTAKMYDQLHYFVSKVGWSLIFDLNVLLRRNGHWDPANALELMEYTVKKGYPMAGWELGNEPNIIDHLIKFYIEPEQLAQDYVYFKLALARFKPFKNSLILGPSVTQLEGHGKSTDYYTRFLKSGGADIVTAATFHQYYMDSAVATVAKFMSPSVLNFLTQEVDYGVNVTQASGSRAQVWLGETSSSWGGGAKGLSDRYVAAFMWLDKLGICAARGVDVVIRQSFYGYNYSLVDNDTFEPLPDYWLTLLYKLLVGSKVLKVITPSNTGKVRAYAHCTSSRSGYKPGSVVVYAMNLDKEDHTLTFPDIADSAPLHLYSMEPAGGDLTSNTVLLNGEALQMVNNSTLPNLLRPVKTQAPVLLKAQTYSFYVWPQAAAKACL